MTLLRFLLAYYLATAALYAETCETKGSHFIVQADSYVDARKYSISCFFSELKVTETVDQDNKRVEVKSSTSLQSLEGDIDWTKMSYSKATGQARWKIQDVREIISSIKSKRKIRVKEIVYESNPSKLEIGLVEIDSDPEEASVYIDGAKVCQTPCKLNLEYGKYQVQIVKRRYKTQSEQVAISSRSFNRTYNLTQTIFPVTLDCDEDIRLKVDSIVVDRDSLELQKGEYVFETLSPNHHPFHEKVNVNGPMNYQCKNRPHIGYLTITASNSSDQALIADVYIDGEYKGVTPTTIDVRSGRKKLRVEKGYNFYETDIDIAKNQSSIINAHLTDTVFDSKTLKLAENKYSIGLSTSVYSVAPEATFEKTKILVGFKSGTIEYGPIIEYRKTGFHVEDNEKQSWNLTRKKDSFKEYIKEYTAEDLGIGGFAAYYLFFREGSYLKFLLYGGSYTSQLQVLDNERDIAGVITPRGLFYGFDLSYKPNFQYLKDEYESYTQGFEVSYGIGLRRQSVTNESEILQIIPANDLAKIYGSIISILNLDVTYRF